MQFIHDDGGRAAAGFKGITDDCVVRAIAIATEMPYREVYDAIHQATLNNRKRMAKLELRYGAQARRHASPRAGVYRDIWKSYLKSLGWVWTPTMLVGQGCQVHLRENELPDGRLIVQVSKHVVAVLNGELHDLDDCSRDGTRCVYGYYMKG